MKAHPLSMLQFTNNPTCHCSIHKEYRYTVCFKQSQPMYCNDYTLLVHFNDYTCISVIHYVYEVDWFL